MAIGNFRNFRGRGIGLLERHPQQVQSVKPEILVWTDPENIKAVISKSAFGDANGFTKFRYQDFSLVFRRQFFLKSIYNVRAV